MGCELHGYNAIGGRGEEYRRVTEGSGCIAYLQWCRRFWSKRQEMAERHKDMAGMAIGKRWRNRETESNGACDHHLAS